MNRLNLKSCIALLVCCLISSSAFADKMEAGKMEDGAMMKDGKMMMMKDGKSMHMDDDMMTTDGKKVMKDGTVMMKDGTKMMMKDGDMMHMDGKMMKEDGKMEKDSMMKH